MNVDYDEIIKAGNMKKTACTACTSGDIKIYCNICCNPICYDCIYEEKYCLFCYNNPIKRKTINQQIYIKQKNKKFTGCFGSFSKKVHPS